jgi:hypothetical protein
LDLLICGIPFTVIQQIIDKEYLIDELKQKGIISEDEFAMLKKRFLDNYQS